MIEQLITTGRAYWQTWARKRARIGNPQHINGKAIYILPTGFGWMYGFLVLSLFTGAINYQISTIFLMTFLLAVIGLISAWETHANINDLSFKLLSVEDAEQGKPILIKLLIHPHGKIRFALEFQIKQQGRIEIEKISPQGTDVLLTLESTKRGYFSLPRITVSSAFPFGIFRAWSYLYFDQHFYVYPKAIDPGFFPLPNSQEKENRQSSPGQEELYDLKQTDNPWVQANRIAWKLAAKEQGWYLKTMSGYSGEYWLFRLRDLTQGDLEHKLQNLSYWLQQAEQKGYIYGMELEDVTIGFGQGQEHLNQMLRQLARY